MMESRICPTCNRCVCADCWDEIVGVCVECEDMDEMGATLCVTCRGEPAGDTVGGVIC